MHAVPWQEWARKPADTYDSIRVVAFGKGALAMSGAVERSLGRAVAGGVAVVPRGYRDAIPADMPVPASIEVVEGDHPVPGTASLRAGERVLSIVGDCNQGDLLIALISGGGSALCARYVQGVSLDDVRVTTTMLLEGGADIHPVNTVRKHLSLIGGGRLAESARCDVLGLVVSDVVGDDLSVVASGPTVPDPSTFDDAVAALQRYGLWERVPHAVRMHFERGLEDRGLETPGPDSSVFDRVRTALIASNRAALAAAATAAGERGYDVRVVSNGLSGEARVVGGELARTALEVTGSRPACLLWSGETTVTVRGSGRGGRNLELALAAGIALESSGRPCVLLSVGTDGKDGSSDAAGAWTSGRIIARARQSGLSPEAYLDDNDSHAFFERTGTLVRTGPTHTNVLDLQVVLVAPEA